jgi:hypothetical protein
VARILIETCDPCERILGIEGMPAERSVNLAINGGPVKRVEFCSQHLHMLKPILDIYEQCGVDEALKPGRRAAKQPAEIESSPGFDAADRVQPELPSVEPEKKEVSEGKDEDHIKVTCSLPHSTGKDATVQYRSRNSHARVQHDGLKVWDIEWGDPAGALLHPCDRHAECMKVKLAFPSAMSLNRHVRMSPLRLLPEVA